MQTQVSPELLTQIAHEFGTPLYVYFPEKIKDQYVKLCSAFQQQDVKIFYACKALTNIHILRYIHALGCNVDCSSINEVKLALYAGFPKEKVLYTSNSIDFSEIEEAQALGVHINIDSLSNLEKFGKKYAHTYPVGIRLRPNVMAGGNLNISTGHDKSKFGIPVDQMNDILSVVSENNMWIRVLHIHTGSEISDVDLYMKAVNVLLNATHNFAELECVDLGGGFKVPYKAGDVETDMNLLSERNHIALSNIERIQKKKYQIWFEPGKYLVSGAGYLIAKVNVLKKTPSSVFAGLDTGLNHLIRPMFYGAYHHIENISNPHGEKQRYNVVGNICETDTFAWDREISTIQEGDLLVFHNAGAYGFEMASNFNSRFKPAEVMVVNGNAQLIRRRDNFEDLLKNQIL